MSKLKSFLSRNKKCILFRPIFFAHSVLKHFKSNIADVQSRRRIKRVSRRASLQSKSRKIRVLFLVIDSNTWNKLKPLYDAMRQRENIELKIVCMMPMPKQQDTSVTYRYFKDHGYDCIDARVGDGPWDVDDKTSQWFDIRALEPDYIFYGEPYNAYFPAQYRSQVTSQYAKICFASYGVTILKNFLYIQPRDFCRDVYFRYATSEEEKNFIISQYRKFYKKGLQKIKYIGNLVFSEFYKARDARCEAWAFSKNKFRAIWTPRWTTDEKIGGSNFLRYKDILLDYAKTHKEMDFLLRPHPMALDNFVKTGQLSEEEAAAFKQTCLEESNLSLDVQKYYANTFWHSDVLIGDISSILVEYFITGHPIIFCKTLHSEQQPLKFFEKILSCCYIADNQAELILHLEQLAAGHDPLKTKRESCIAELFNYDFEGVADKMIDDIISDFYT